MKLCIKWDMVFWIKLRKGTFNDFIYLDGEYKSQFKVVDFKEMRMKWIDIFVYDKDQVLRMRTIFG